MNALVRNRNVAYLHSIWMYAQKSIEKSVRFSRELIMAFPWEYKKREGFFPSDSGHNVC